MKMIMHNRTECIAVDNMQYANPVHRAINYRFYNLDCIINLDQRYHVLIGYFWEFVSGLQMMCVLLLLAAQGVPITVCLCFWSYGHPGV